MKLKFFLIDQLVIGFLNEDRDSTIRLSERIEQNCMVWLSKEDSEDVTQEVLSAIWRNGNRIRFDLNPGSYATKINKNKIIDKLREPEREDIGYKGQVKMDQDSPDSDADGSMTKDSGKDIERIESKDLSQARIIEHNELCRLIDKIGNNAPTKALRNGWIALKYLINEHSYFYIAVKMGVPETSIKTWINRFRKYLREELEKYGWDRIELNKAMGF